MRSLIERVARRLWPDFAQQPAVQQQTLLVELLVVSVSLPLLAVAIGVLVLVTEVAVFQARWPLFLLLLALSLVLTYLSFFQRTGREAGRYSYNSSDLEGVMNIAALLLLGPTGIWLHLLNRLIYFGTTWPSRRFSLAQRWNWLRNLLYNLVSGIVTSLLALAVYGVLGGRLPFPGLVPTDTLAAFVAFSVELGASLLLVRLLLRVFAVFLGEQRIRELRREVIFFILLAGLPGFFGILGAALYSEMGWPAFLFFGVGVILVSLLARRLSQAAVESQQRATELVQLEQLGRAIIEGPATVDHLAHLLGEALPHMFDYTHAEIFLFPQQRLLQLPAGRSPLPEELWRWFREDPEARLLDRDAPVPGRAAIPAASVRLVPILSSESQEPVGGVALVLETQHIVVGLDESLLSLQVLAAQIASALQRIETQAQMLAYERVRQELAFARQIQSSFIPGRLPALPGWDLVATLQPARQTSGDFYDVILLPGGKVGLVMADVADKGVGAALFMALSRTLVRTYATTFPERPQAVLAATNARILEETSNDMFVTVFYAILDPESGELTYANAGHNPPFIGREPLPITGMPLGILPEATWDARQVSIRPEQILILYTDGVTEAHNAQEAMFGTERLLAVTQAHRQEGAAATQAAILEAVAAFVGSAAQFDDMALLLLRRERVRGYNQ